jgi:hypothetical protein
MLGVADRVAAPLGGIEAATGGWDNRERGRQLSAVSNLWLVSRSDRRYRSVGRRGRAGRGLPKAGARRGERRTRRRRRRLDLIRLNSAAQRLMLLSSVG